MRIGINCFLLQENIGGMRQYFHRLFRELLANDHDNSYVFFYFEHNICELEQLGNDRWKEGAILLDSQDGANFHLDKIDVYFCPFGALWPRPVKVPSVVMIHDIQEKYYPQFFSKKVLFDREFYYDPSTHIADHVITISRFTKDSIVKHHSVSPDKISVAYHSLSDDFSKAPSPRESCKLTLPLKFIFYPANRWAHKNHDNMLKAICILKQKFNLAVDCIFTGHDAPGRYPLKEKILHYGLEGQVQILGYLTEAEIKHIYKEATMLCFPSIFEGFGMPILEAMSLGCPVVCSNATSIPEVAGDAALLFNGDDPEEIAHKIYRLWNDEDLRNDLIKLGESQAVKFNPQITAQKHIEAFTKAASSFCKYKYFYNKFFYDPLFKAKVVIKYKYQTRFKSS